jgi:GMP synthase (glutamine-hydrolysing)
MNLSPEQLRIFPMTSASPSVQSSITPLSTEKVAILDCGAQYTKVIDRRVRELNVYSEILPLSTPAEALKHYNAIILSGGPNSVFAEDAPPFDAQILQLNIPVLGICYGMQLIAHHLKGTVQPGAVKEFGETAIQVETGALLFDSLPAVQTVLMSHGDKVVKLPDGFTQIAASGDIVAAMMHVEKRIYGVQFHPEVELSEHGQAMLENFLYKVAGLQGDFPLDSRLNESLDQIRETVGNGNVFVLVSGGVDSAVTAALLLKALGPDQVFALHVDTGFMRHQESDTVCQALTSLGLKHLKHLKAEEAFLNATTDIDGQPVGPLKSLSNPEEKRRVIGDTFFRLTQEAILEMNLDLEKTFIAQGTLRPDLIESGNVGVSQIAHKIKTHHNDVPLIQEQREKGLIIEPNRDWHKDEVRKIGAMLGLSEDVVQRQPFPGPGLGIRVLCTDTPYLTDAFETLNAYIHRQASTIGLQGNILPVKSVGVQGDYRSYSYLAVMSGNYPKDWDRLRTVARNIPNQYHLVNRVALVLNRNLPLPQVIKHVTPTFLNRQSLDLLRAVDYEVTETFRKAGLLSQISQLLAVLVPIDVGQQGRYSIALRAVVTSDYMTARPAKLGDEIPWELIEGLAERIIAQHPIDWVLYDLTSKPPATVEWE